MKLFFNPFTVSNNECGGSCNTTDDPYVCVCVRNKGKNVIVNVFLISTSVCE